MKNSVPYKHVAVLGIDGMGRFNRETDTPCMDKMFKNGATTYDALSMNPTISAENWGAMLLGANPVVHGLTNSIVGQYEYNNKELRSVFARIREVYPDAYLASCCNWSPINYGIIEHDIGVDFSTADDDRALMPSIIDAVAKKPTFLFVQFDDVDGAGHRFGYGEKGHLEKITEIDALVGEVYEAYGTAGILSETLILVIADHGGIRNGHGGYMDSEKYIFLGACGKNVPHGEIGKACTKDIAATVMYALGIDIPDYNALGFSSQIPSGIFPGEGGGYFVPEAKSLHIESKQTPGFNALDGLAAFLPKEKIKLALFFDNDLTDASGRHTASQHGNVKYYSGGVRGSYGEFGITGHAVYNGVSVGNGSFSVAVWIEIDRSLNEAPALCGNKDWWWQNRRGRGVILSLRKADTVFNVGTGDDDFDFVTPFPEDVADGWIHTILTVDKEKKEVRCYYNFRLAHTMKLEEKYMCSLDSLPFTVGDDATGTYNRESHSFLVHMDDLLLLDGTLSDEQILSLAHYYNK